MPGDVREHGTLPMNASFGAPGDHTGGSNLSRRSIRPPLESLLLGPPGRTTKTSAHLPSPQRVVSRTTASDVWRTADAPSTDAVRNTQAQPKSAAAVTASRAATQLARPAESPARAISPPAGDRPPLDDRPSVDASAHPEKWESLLCRAADHEVDTR